jgi:hypothetical protein
MQCQSPPANGGKVPFRPRSRAMIGRAFSRPDLKVRVSRRNLIDGSESCGAVSTDILEFLARVLVIQAASSGGARAAPILDTVLPVYSGDPLVPGSRVQTRERRGFRWSAVGDDHAAASIVEHVRHATDRLASTRAWRAAAARAVRSAGTASPLPKYISSGVCPRNAECGSTWLC